jgi:thioredoxin reductase
VRQTEIVVVGAGPAGLSAALAAHRTGAQVTVVDEYPRPGGQIYRQIPEPFAPLGPGSHGREKERAGELFQRLAGSSVELLSETLLWGVEEGKTLLLYREGEGVESLQAGAVVVATGAYDRPIAFPGWTLPGVWAAGGAQAMLKGQHVLPGQRVLVAGAGPLLLPLAKLLVESGATVVGVVEATTRVEWVRHGYRMWGHWDRMLDAYEYEGALLRAGIPRYFGHVVRRAEGGESLERVTIAPVDRQWRPLPRGEKSFDVDLLCTGYGFLSSMELPRTLGCRLAFNVAQEQYLPLYNHDMESSVPGVFVAGETTGVGGAEMALAEGEIAGLAAARLLGHELSPQLHEEMAQARARRRHQAGFARMLDDLFAMRPGIYELPEPDTLICRCEEVSAQDILVAVDRGAGSANALKGWTRVGMGPCQGRICGNLAAHLVARETGRPIKGLLDFSVRPPIKPVPLGALASLSVG